jgi:hypothetical protein
MKLCIWLECDLYDAEGWITRLDHDDKGKFTNEARAHYPAFDHVVLCIIILHDPSFPQPEQGCSTITQL